MMPNQARTAAVQMVLAPPFWSHRWDFKGPVVMCAVAMDMMCSPFLSGHYLSFPRPVNHFFVWCVTFFMWCP